MLHGVSRWALSMTLNAWRAENRYTRTSRRSHRDSWRTAIHRCHHRRALSGTRREERKGTLDNQNLPTPPSRCPLRIRARTVSSKLLPSSRTATMFADPKTRVAAYTFSLCRRLNAFTAPTEAGKGIRNRGLNHCATTSGVVFPMWGRRFRLPIFSFAYARDSANSRSSEPRSQPARSAAAPYELSRNSTSASSGDDSARRSSYFRMNSPSAVLYPALAGRIVALSRPTGAGAA